MYQIEDLMTGEMLTLTEEEANEKFGAGRFNEILAGLDADYTVRMDDDIDESMDGDFDSAMASAGFGTDEDYGYFGDDGDYL